ncbi:hypothetical protein A2U01_0093642, partial [Trifolium medium]|nr:hypothetical protein [Trifolium medium]
HGDGGGYDNGRKKAGEFEEGKEGIEIGISDMIGDGNLRSVTEGIGVDG